MTSVHRGVANGPSSALELMHPPRSEPRVYFAPVNYEFRCSIWTCPECHTRCLIAFLCSACTLNLELMATPCCFSFDAGDVAFTVLCMALCMVNKLDAAYRGSSKRQRQVPVCLPLIVATQDCLASPVYLWFLHTSLSLVN